MKPAPVHSNARKTSPVRVVITGFMGTGKTETARSLSEILGLEFVDTDRLIEEMEGMSVVEIFEKRGESHFRRREEGICAALSERSGVVIATGGGTLVNEKNFDVLSRQGRVVLLEADVEAIRKRVGRDGSRPLLAGPNGSKASDEEVRARIRSILEERRAAYGRIPRRIDTSKITPVEAANRIAASLDLPSRTIAAKLPAGWASSDSAAVRMEIGRGLLSALGARLREDGRLAGIFILIPGNLRDLFLPQIAASLDQASIPWEAVQVRDGDAEKNLDQVRRLIDELAERGAARDSTIVAVGGGVVGDLGGFVASVYMRGVPLVHVPTTLLAQVDSSIGGKVGVNHARAKNLIGGFYQPHLVLSDPCALRTLPDPEISNGMAEVVKTAVIGSADLFVFMEKELAVDPARTLRSVDFLEPCIAECAAVKSAIVERDPFERDERRVLNLGHTLGHALEAVAGYRELTHGQAVSIGLAAAMRIAESRGLVDSGLVGRTRGILERCGLPVDPPEFDEARLGKSLHLDKKKRSGRLHFVLPTGLGSVTIVDDVTEAEIREAMGRKGR